MADTGKEARTDVPVGFYFSVEFKAGPNGDSINVGASHIETRFQEVAGLTSELGIETFDEGGENRFSHRLPTRAKFNNLILKRGMLLGNSELRKWFEDALTNFSFKPLNVTVNLLNGASENDILSSWEFHSVWPVKWTVSDFKAMENALVIESAELAYQYYQKTK